jgi:hypothetical protein
LHVDAARREIVAGMSSALPAFYWIEPQRLAAARDKARPRQLAGLIEAGIRGFVDLTPDTGFGGYLGEAQRLAEDGDVLHRRFPIRDFDVPAIATMRAILDAIDEWRAAARPVYVHCHAGIGRTGTVIACWLVRHGAAPAEAFAMIEELRRGTQLAGARSPETDAQRAFVETWRREG